MLSLQQQAQLVQAYAQARADQRDLLKERHRVVQVLQVCCPCSACLPKLAACDPACAPSCADPACHQQLWHTLTGCALQTSVVLPVQVS